MGKGHVVELGCGPAHVAAYIASRGVDISGLDLSPQMVEQAHRLFPTVKVVVGDMLALPFADRSLGGVIAFYSIIHFDDAQLATAFSRWPVSSAATAAWRSRSTSATRCCAANSGGTCRSCWTFGSWSRT